MGLFDFLMKDEKETKDKELFLEDAENLGLTEEEIEDALESGIAPEEWLEENELENYHDQDLDKD